MADTALAHMVSQDQGHSLDSDEEGSGRLASSISACCIQSPRDRRLEAGAHASIHTRATTLRLRAVGDSIGLLQALGQADIRSQRAPLALSLQTATCHQSGSTCVPRAWHSTPGDAAGLVLNRRACSLKAENSARRACSAPQAQHRAQSHSSQVGAAFRTGQHATRIRRLTWLTASPPHRSADTAADWLSTWLLAWLLTWLQTWLLTWLLAWLLC